MFFFNFCCSSTVHALVAMLHDWYKLTDDSTSGRYIRILLVDYTKAFDRIDPNIFVHKLIALDVSQTLIALICSFLTSRRQRVKIGKFTFSWLDIWGNVPQGTLLGVLLFLIMINDLRLELPTYKFVDDTTVYEACTDQSTSIQSAANRICDLKPKRSW